MLGLGWQELVIVLVIIMLIFGAGKLPDVARSLGQGVKEVREASQEPIAQTAIDANGSVVDAESTRSAAV